MGWDDASGSWGGVRGYHVRLLCWCVCCDCVRFHANEVDRWGTEGGVSVLGATLLPTHHTASSSGVGMRCMSSMCSMDRT